MRQNCNYLFLFNLSNWRIINSLWQKSLSTTEDYADWKVFFAMFKKHTRGQFDKRERKMIMNYNALAVHTTSKQVSWELKDWFLEEMEKIRPTTKNHVRR